MQIDFLIDVYMSLEYIHKKIRDKHYEHNLHT